VSLVVLTALLTVWAIPAESQAAASLPVLSVEGNHLVQAGRSGPFHLHGVNRDTLEWGQNPTGTIDWNNANWGGCGGDGHFTDKDYANIASWGANTVRIPLSQANWLGRRCDPAAYKRMVDDAVSKANARGMYVILDLHWTDVGGKAPCKDDSTCSSGQQPMPDSDSVVFWDGVAARYANDPGVLFNLHNEPYIYHKPWVYNSPDAASWKCWKYGGCTVYASEQTSPKDPATGKPKPLAYKAVGMQKLYNTVRKRAPKNVVLIGGLDWAYDLSGVGKGYAISGTNIVYDTHVYTQWHNTTSDWDQHFGYLTKSKPVSATEFGSIDCKADVTKRLVDYFDAPMGRVENRMSWTIWSWNSPGECSQPTVLADWDGTPLADQGKLIYERLRAYPK
jgi:endoglucanase